MMQTKTPSTGRLPSSPKAKRWAWLKQDWQLYGMLTLPVIYYLVFKYMPMYGTLIAFKKYSARKGIWGSKWVGLANFEKFLQDPYFYKLIRNTLMINLYCLLFAFTASILFALLLNEMRSQRYRKLVQTVSYLPHFISTVVVCGLVTNFLRTNGGIINDLIALFGFERISFMTKPEYFRGIYVISEIWQHMGWDAIIYIAALTAIDQQLYEAARIEGANRFQQTLHVTLPGIAPTITIMLIMRVGNMMNLGYEKVLLMYSGATYETADIIGTYVYRRGLMTADFSYGTAIGLFQTMIALILVTVSNWVGRKISDTGLW